MAFYSAETTERSTLRTIYSSLYQSSKALISRYFGISTWIWITYYVPSPAYITVLSILYLLNSGPFASQSFADKTQASGSIMALFYVTLNITYALGGIFNLLGSFGIVLGTTTRISELIERCDELDQKRIIREAEAKEEQQDDNEEESVIRVSNVRISVPKAKEEKSNVNEEEQELQDQERILIDDLSFEVKKGSALLIQGPSGSGKSSLLRIIGGLWPLSSNNGTVTLPASKSESVFFLPQKSYIFRGTMSQNLTYPNHHSEIDYQTAVSLIQAVGLGHLEWDVNTIMTNVRDWNEELSLGEMQRVGFARLLFHNPTFAFLDEASSALDSENERKCYSEVVRRGITCVSIAHRDCLREYHQTQLLLSPDDASWSLTPVDPNDIPRYEYEWEEIESANFGDDSFDDVSDDEGTRRRSLFNDDDRDIESEENHQVLTKRPSSLILRKRKVPFQPSCLSLTARFFRRFFRLCGAGSLCCSSPSDSQQNPNQAIFMRRKKIGWWVFALTTIISLLSSVPDLIIVALSPELLNAAVERVVGKVVGIAIAYFACFLAAALLYATSEFLTSRYALEIRTGTVEYLHERYLRSRIYYEVNVLHDKVENPDQRITQDVDFLTGDWASVYVTFLYGIFGIGIEMVFSLAMGYWTIPFICIGVFLLIIVCMVFLTWLVGHYQFIQQKREGYFRHSLGRLRAHSEQIAFLSGEEREDERIRSYFADVMSNQLVLSLIGALNDNLISFCQKFAVVLPYLIISAFVLLRSFDLTESTTAKRITLVQMYTLLVEGVLTKLLELVATTNQVGQIVGNTGRVVGLIEHFDELEEVIETKEGEKEEEDSNKILRPVVGSSNLTVFPPNRPDKVLFRKYTFEIGKGQDLLIRGVSGVGKSSLLRVVSGLWEHHSGRIESPPLLKDGDTIGVVSPEQEEEEEGERQVVPRVLFLPQKPYMLAHGSLRDQIAYPRKSNDSSDDDDERMMSILQEVNLSKVTEALETEEDSDCLDVVRDWESTLSPGEQQRLSMARLIYNQPTFAFLDESTSALDTDNESNLSSCCKKHGITVVSVGHGDTLYQYHSHVLELFGKEGWQFKRKIASEETEEKDAFGSGLVAEEVEEITDDVVVAAEEVDQHKSGK